MAKEQQPRRLATLVGCNYTNTKYKLSGCVNDAVDMRDLLISRFGFAPGDITLLRDAADDATPSVGAPELLPTGANIRQALGHMIGRAEPGDVLLFHYSGHGTLIPAAKPHQPWHKYDEAIVPCDFNLITDVDFRQLVDRLPAGATFTMVSDSCHSGGLIEKEKEQIGPSTISATGVTERSYDQLRAIPFESLLSHLASLSDVDSPHVGDHLLELFGLEAISPKFTKLLPADGDNLTASAAQTKNDGAILLSGCQTNETSSDVSAQDPVAGGRACGAFSNALQTVLRRWRRREGGAAAISNRELVMETREVLREQGFEGQHPCLYCTDQNADLPFLRQPTIIKELIN